MDNIIVVTRHPALVQYLVERGLVETGVPVVAHATERDVKGKNVIGVLPLWLASLADSVTEIPLRLPPELRGQELSVEQVRKYAGEPVTYAVMTTSPKMWE